MSTSSFVRSSLCVALVTVFGCSRGPAPSTESEPQPMAVMPSRVAPTSAPAATPIAPVVAPVAIAPAAAPAAPSVATSSEGLVAKRVVVTRKIEHREPVTGDALVAASEPLFAFIELSNASSEEQKVFVTFESKSGLSVGHVQLSVPANARRWRTWARTMGVRSAGEWTAVVRGVDGKELGRETFEIAALSAPSPTRPTAASTTPPSAAFPAVLAGEASGSSKPKAGS